MLIMHVSLTRQAYAYNICLDQDTLMITGVAWPSPDRGVSPLVKSTRTIASLHVIIVMLIVYSLLDILSMFMTCACLYGVRL